MKFIYTLVITCLFAFTQEDKKNLIAWSPTYKLQWTDFKATPQDGTLKAMTWSTIELETKKIDATVIVLNIGASFIKNKSWKKKDIDNADLLTHEQKHFDITEIYARKLRKKLSETKFTDTKKAMAEIQKIYNQTFSESSAEQKKYDAETKHSLIKEEQDKWNKQVADDLQALNAYTTTEVTIVIKK